MRASACLAVICLSCASSKAEQRDDAPKTGSGNVGGAAAAAAIDLNEMNARLRDSQDRATSDCGAIERRAVPASEERAMGEAMMVALAAGTARGFYVDPSETDPRALKAKVDAARGKRDVLRLGPGKKNALNEYVQRIGLKLVGYSQRPSAPWTFGVLDDDAPKTVSTMGGYVMVTTGLLKVLKNEAQLAALLATEIAHVAAKHPAQTYALTLARVCKTSQMGLSLVQSGAGSVPGGNDFVTNAKFGKTMKRLSSTDPTSWLDDPEVDAEFVRYLVNQSMAASALLGEQRDDVLADDALGHAMLAAAGYDTREMVLAFEALGNRSMPGKLAIDRIEAVTRLREGGGFGTTGGTAPAFPKDLELPR